jgi:hypothetical protein
VLTSCLFALTSLMFRVQPKPAQTTPWFDVQEGTVSARYRYLVNSADSTTSQMQDRIAFRGRLTPPSATWFALDIGAFSGTSFTGGWNNTGIGTGDRVKTFSVKQLYAELRPVKEVEAQVGSLYAARGQATEITTYDNDAYLTGERVTVRPASRFIVDTLSFTNAYVGDMSTPNVFERLDRLADSNYLQVMAEKTLPHQVAVSAEWSRPPEGQTLRGAGRFPLPGELSAIKLRIEAYWRLHDDAGGFAVAAERQFGPRVQLSGGYADIDEHFPAENGDRYGNGRRLFALGNVAIVKNLSASAFFTQAVDTPFTIPVSRRFDAVVTYNVVGAVLDAVHHHSSSPTR